MSAIIIRGGRPLSGSLTVQGAKNSVLPILAATLLSGEVCRIRHCPRLRDVETAMEILRHLGCRADWQGRDLLVDAADPLGCAGSPHEPNALVGGVSGSHSCPLRTGGNDLSRRL